jgi:hypothetical protein
MNKLKCPKYNSTYIQAVIEAILIHLSHFPSPSKSESLILPEYYRLNLQIIFMFGMFNSYIRENRETNACYISSISMSTERKKNWGKQEVFKSYLKE